ncbi:hypothetical protein GCM10023238_21720 [Streptomyces heliomycini]
MTAAATVISASLRGCRSSSPSQAQRRMKSRAAATKNSDQTIRWARISTAPAGLSRGQNSGTSPHIPYAAKPFSSPVRRSAAGFPVTGPSFVSDACPVLPRRPRTRARCSPDDGNAGHPRVSCPYRHTVMTGGGGGFGGPRVSP